MRLLMILPFAFVIFFLSITTSFHESITTDPWGTVQMMGIILFVIYAGCWLVSGGNVRR